MATTTRAKRRKIEALEAKKQQLLEIQNETVDSQDSEDEEYIPNTPNPKPSEEFKSDSSKFSNHSLIVDDFNIEKESLVSAKQKPSRPKTCFVWKFFSEPENDYVICQVANCKAKLKYCNTPATMKTHLAGVHRITEASLKKKSIDELKTSQISGQLTLHQTYEVIHPYSQQRMKQLHKSLTQFVIGTDQPLSIVEEPDFIKYSYDLNPKYKLPCIKTLKEHIDSIYCFANSKIEQELSCNANDVSLTLDLWSSCAHQPYLGITVHWVDENFYPCEFLLNMEEFPYPHDAFTIAEEINNIIHSYNLEFKVTAIVTDNGSNVKSAIEQLGICKRIPCSAHTLQLSILKGLEKVSQLTSKCKELIRFLSGDKKRQQLREAQAYLIRQQERETAVDNSVQDELDDKNSIIDVVKSNNTRWNSTFYAYERLLLLKSAIITLKETLLQDKNNKNQREGELLEEMLPTTNEWKVIKELTELLNPFEMATRLLSGQQYPTLSLIYPTMLSLKNLLLTDFNHFKSSEVKLVRDEIQEDLSIRWDYPEDMGIYAAFYDPRFKDLYFLDQVCIYFFKN